MDAALQLHKDKEELVQVGGPKLHKSRRTNLGGFIMRSQAGGSWEDGADEPPSPFTRRNVMRNTLPKRLAILVIWL